MRNIVVLCGPSQSGKDSWINERDLRPFAVSSDDIRLMLGEYEYDVDGNPTIGQKANSKVFKVFYDMIERRMRKGAFTIVNATNLEARSFSRIKKLADKYRYRTYVKFFNVGRKDLLLRNEALKGSASYVPPSVIDKQFARYADLKVPTSFKRIDQIEEVPESINFHPVGHERIWFVGDIHGQFKQLDEFFSRHYNEDDYFVFLGDYLDRGTQNAETMQFLLDIYKLPNITFLEGNHEIWLRMWAEDWEEEIKSHAFKKFTQPELEAAKISKKSVASFCRQLATVYAVEQDGVKILACHGGVPSANLLYAPASNYIKGIGDYEDLSLVYAQAIKENVVFIHGHRNVDSLPIKPAKNIFNLDCHIERPDGAFRAVAISGTNKFPLTVSIPTNVKEATNNNFLHKLSTHFSVKERVQPIANISSFNVTRKGFYEDDWDDITKIARALYLDNKTGEVFARAYPKMFNTEEFDAQELAKTIKPPYKLWQKYNGFMCLVRLDSKEQDLIFMTKSGMDTEYAGIARDVISSQIDRQKTIQTLKELKEFTLIFEVICPSKDPHIIEYNHPHAVLLDAIKNKFELEKLPYDILTAVGTRIRAKVKSMSAVSYNTTGSFFLARLKRWKQSNETEGCVIEDANGFMWKQKTDYYNRWKAMRRYLKKLKKNPNLAIDYDALDQTQVAFLKFVIQNEFIEEFPEKSIIDLRNKFYFYENLATVE